MVVPFILPFHVTKVADKIVDPAGKKLGDMKVKLRMFHQELAWILNHEESRIRRRPDIR